MPFAEEVKARLRKNRWCENKALGTGEEKEDGGDRGLGAGGARCDEEGI